MRAHWLGVSRHFKTHWKYLPIPQFSIREWRRSDNFIEMLVSCQSSRLQDTTKNIPCYLLSIWPIWNVILELGEWRLCAVRCKHKVDPPANLFNCAVKMITHSWRGTYFSNYHINSGTGRSRRSLTRYSPSDGQTNMNNLVINCTHFRVCCLHSLHWLQHKTAAKEWTRNNKNFLMFVRSVNSYFAFLEMLSQS